MYKTPINAFGYHDPKGLGYITLQSMLNSNVVKTLEYSRDDLEAFLHLNNCFKNNEQGLSY
jgi:hypothetical protein